MRETRKEIRPGVFLTCLQTDKFKTGLLSVNLLTRLSRDTAAKNALIPSVLRRGTMSCPDMDALAARLDSLYGARLEPAVRKSGEIQCVGFWADFVDEAWLPEGESGLLEKIAALMGEVLLEPNSRGGLLLPQYVDSEKEKLLEDIRARVNDKISYSRYRMTELMCPEEDYAVDVLGTEEEAQAIGYVALTRHYGMLLARSPVLAFYCGTADPERVERALQDALATLPRFDLDWDLGTDIRMKTVEEGPRTFIEDMDVAQGKLAIGYRLGAAMERPDVAALRVMNAVFGGGVSSKLFMNVREKLSLCYFASSRVDLSKGVLTVISGIEVGDYDQALAEIGRQLQAVKDGDITDEELDSAKRGLVNDLLSVTDSTGALEAFWLEKKLGSEYDPEELAALVENVTREDVVKAAAGIKCDMVYFLRGSEGNEDAED